MAYPNLKADPTLLQNTNRDNEIETIKNKTEKHDFRKFSTPPWIDEDSYKKNYTIIEKKTKYI